MKAPGDSVAAFAGWCVVGAALTLSILTLLTIGPFVLLVTLMLIGYLLWRVDFGWAMAGMISGAGLPVLYVAWLNRDGPGEVCTRTATQVSCTDEWSPWPFVALGVVLLVGGVFAFLRNRFR
jgi:hypothetical protein